MLALFCLRLAFGMLAALLLLSPAQINPRFYRTHFLTALGLGAGALALSWDARGPLLAVLGGALLLAFLGSVSWSLERAPGGRVLVVLTALALGAALWAARSQGGPAVAESLPGSSVLWQLTDDLTSSALLGVALTAMLMGHSYLIAPAMSLTPLRRLLLGLFVALGLRLAFAAVGLWFWTGAGASATLKEVTLLWLPLRWGLGFVLPLVLGVMAWQTARIRSTQSATGILYIVVVFCFLGELTGQLLFNVTRHFI
jgi:hypothetical protein